MTREKFRPLNEKEQNALLAIARNAIYQAVGQHVYENAEFDFPIFHEKRGAFVTLHSQGMLRGCIGFVLARRSLRDTVVDMAVAAALRDPRFAPVEPQELEDLDIEISILTPMQEIENVDDIKVGVHGIYLQKGLHSGLLLPQVATEYNWDRETFLQQTCRKAGLPLHAWQEKDTKISVFSAQVFGE